MFIFVRKLVPTHNFEPPDHWNKLNFLLSKRTGDNSCILGGNYIVWSALHNNEPELKPHVDEQQWILCTNEDWRKTEYGTKMHVLFECPIILRERVEKKMWTRWITLMYNYGLLDGKIWQHTKKHKDNIKNNLKENVKN